MRRPRLRACLAAALIVASATTLWPARATAETLRDLLPFGRTHRIAKLLQTVVNIATHKMSAAPADASDKSEPQRTEAFGSGFITPTMVSHALAKKIGRPRLQRRRRRVGVVYVNPNAGEVRLAFSRARCWPGGNRSAFAELI